MRHARLGDLLSDAGLITTEQLDEALLAQRRSGKRLGEQLVASGFITDRQLVDALTVQLGIEFADLSPQNLPAPEVVRLIPRSLARRYSMLPYKVEGDTLHLAMSDPLNTVAAGEARSVCGMSVVPMIGIYDEVTQAIETLYDIGGTQTEELGPAAQLELSQAEAPAVPSLTSTLADRIIERALSDRASDIHFIPGEEGLRVLLRVDGQLHDNFEIPRERQQALISRIKAMCSLPDTQTTMPQLGRTMLRIRGREADIRASTLPTLAGERIHLRLYDPSERISSLEELGLRGAELSAIKRVLSHKHGLIVLAGMVGSGVSTTLSLLASRLVASGRSVVTIEDPVEFPIEGVAQLQVNPRAGLGFFEGMHAAVLQDPDVIMLGALPAADLASLAVSTARAGRLVVVALPAENAADAIHRMYEFGITPDQLASCLRAVVAQRLARRVCSHCGRVAKVSQEKLEQLGLDKTLTPMEGQGCPECFDTGCRDRIALVELVELGEASRACLREQYPSCDFESCASEDYLTTMKQSARRLVADGIIPLSELEQL
ncbi:MAG: Flp pilus assembly complex ATPase component TadA [Atopobiaceae bacterium]|nr:Flp pilus assembly complex ATPase component TadA [Atopobiaceae bacterium]